MKDLSMHIMDILQNSIRAEATLISLDIVEDADRNLLQVEFADNGTGMSPQITEKITDPFYTTRKTRKVGLGLPLLKQNVERTGGYFRIQSQEGKGTRVTAQFVLDHLDRPVLGDVPGAILLTITANPEIGFTYSHTKAKKRYSLSTSGIKMALGDIPLSTPMVYQYLHEMITENLNEIGVRLNS